MPHALVLFTLPKMPLFHGSLQLAAWRSMHKVEGELLSGFEMDWSVQDFEVLRRHQSLI